MRGDQEGNVGLLLLIVGRERQPVVVVAVMSMVIIMVVVQVGALSRDTLTFGKQAGQLQRRRWLLAVIRYCQTADSRLQRRLAAILLAPRCGLQNALPTREK